MVRLVSLFTRSLVLKQQRNKGPRDKARGRQFLMFYYKCRNGALDEAGCTNNSLIYPQCSTTMREVNYEVYATVYRPRVSRFVELP